MLPGVSHPSSKALLVPMKKPMKVTYTSILFYDCKLITRAANAVTGEPFQKQSSDDVEKGGANPQDDTKSSQKEHIPVSGDISGEYNVSDEELEQDLRDELLAHAIFPVPGAAYLK